MSQEMLKDHAPALAAQLIDRRRFLKISGLAGGGLALAFFLKGGKAEAARETTESGQAFAPNAYVQITADGIIILGAKNPECGQGVKTTFPMIIAEELEVSWEQIKVVQTPVDKEVFGRQSAGGSQSVPTSWDLLRQAGALARTMLVAAAAQKWQADPADCHAEKGVVHHRPTGKSLAYGELADAAARLPVPDLNTVKLKDRKDYRIIGTWIPGVDNEDIVRGNKLFGFDQSFPGMVYATFVKCPQFGGKVKSANLEQVKMAPGVKDAFIIEGNGKLEELADGVAIIADSTYAAFQAAGQLRIEWDTQGAANDSWTGLAEKAKTLSEGTGTTVLRESGDIGNAFAEADKSVEGYYQYSFVAHATLEPQNCTAWFHDGVMEVWAPSQNPQAGKRMAVEIAGVPRDKVVLHQLRIGGGFGRRLRNDYVCEVVAIAKRIEAPVKLAWTREADMTHDFYRAGGFHRLRGAVDGKGRLSAWHGHFVSFSKTENEKEEVSGSKMSRGTFPFPMIPNIKLEESRLPLGIPCGAWRAPGSCTIAWMVQSFLHELSSAAGRDHREFLIELLGERRWTGRKRPNDLHTGRAIDVINLAADKSGWGKPLPEGHALGLAFHFCHKGHFAEVAEVSVDDNKNVKVHKVVVAGDVGVIISRSGAENQCEGSVADGLSAMAGQEVTFEGGAVRETNFQNYPLLKMPQCPEVEVHFIESDFSPTGLGEPALPPVAPAVCNAIYDITGHRIRTLPISREGFKL